MNDYENEFDNGGVIPVGITYDCPLECPYSDGEGGCLQDINSENCWYDDYE